MQRVSAQRGTLLPAKLSFLTQSPSHAGHAPGIQRDALNRVELLVRDDKTHTSLHYIESLEYSEKPALLNAETKTGFSSIGQSSGTARILSPSSYLCQHQHPALLPATIQSRDQRSSIVCRFTTKHWIVLP